MKALVCNAFGPIEDLKVEDVESPSAGPGQVVVAIKAAALNFPDALIVQGLYQVKPALPFSPGAEFAGVVKTVGEGVSHLKVGERVMALVPHGGLAEECAVDARGVIPLPDDMDYATGSALLLTYCTSLHALKDVAKLAAGETLLVLGASGGVGIAAIEIGKLMGARVIAAASSEEKLALCREHGADETIDYVRDDLRERVDALTEKRGVDVVYDAVGGAYSEAALRATSWGGRLLVVGFATGEIPRIPLNLALLKEREILGVYWGDWAKRNPKLQQAHLLQLLDWFRNQQIAPPVTEQLPLAGAVDALQRIAKRQVRGKVVVLVDK
ncbi:NADPH:quinone oxidoreductase family protein [Rhodanobacter sp. MP1X3]|uniref:NADPH:quinone oxidoreductase family protein n=1 Tax=Rhodanobacter sp. MP1X3 TaxID=2723086 RepID=UPI00160BB715|nr:NADPH:quinone oxidoreductase family protein [Rhodanobacter sp. MP1X3]MBB6241741.1 NADPH2:quinone reductase [Rhodanobacter sp. MP1X3]